MHLVHRIPLDHPKASNRSFLLSNINPCTGCTIPSANRFLKKKQCVCTLQMKYRSPGAVSGTVVFPLLPVRIAFVVFLLQYINIEIPAMKLKWRIVLKNAKLRKAPKINYIETSNRQFEGDIYKELWMYIYKYII